MAVVVLIVIGIVLQRIFSDNNSKPKQVNQHQKKSDKEFEDIHLIFLTKLYYFGVMVVFIYAFFASKTL